MNLDDSKIIDILLREHYVSEKDMAVAKNFSEKHNIPITENLLATELITKDLLGQAIAESIGLAYADLNTYVPKKEQILRIPENIAREFRTVLFNEDEKNIIFCSDNPLREDLLPKLQEIFPKKNLLITYSLTEDIDNTLIHYKKSLEKRFASIIESKKRVAPLLIDEVIKDALTQKASDIHFEPVENTVLIRFRIDGVLQEIGTIPKEHYENILNLIKVQAKLRIDEHYSAQDGAIRYPKKENQFIDLRVSLIPTLNGEKIVIRVLAEYIKDLKLKNLGLSDANQFALEKASKKPFGMILVVGPTGSGKTTTLYALLKDINKPEINITTIEDPVEYKIAGINQIQINQSTNLTFAKGLRSIIRQDPDIILVGEIRDKETAEIAVNAALTGHLLLSTFHANDASTAIPRMLDMGIEPFLLASTMELIIAQRLLRKICENCRVSISKNDPSVQKGLKMLDSRFSSELKNLYKGKGCHICNQSGYHGRSAIYEIITISPDIENLILSNPSKQKIWEIASKQGSITMFEDGLEKVKKGITSLEELIRVASPPNN